VSDVPIGDISITESPDNGVAEIRLQRPDKLNALRTLSLDGLRAGVDELSAAPWCRVLLITGSGRAFCSGADNKERAGWDDAARASFISKGRELFDKLGATAVVSIAAVHGYVLGGGLELALACDVRVAARSATLGFPEVTLGHLPGWDGPARYAALAGHAAALHALLTGDRLDAAQALQAGVVDRVVDDAELHDVARSLAQTYAAAPEAVIRHVKQAIRPPLPCRPSPRLDGTSCGTRKYDSGCRVGS
jgi:enoyl-CoA hydratase/carnithine racemase